MSHNLLIKPPAQVSLRPCRRPMSRAGHEITRQLQAHFPGCHAFKYPADYADPCGHYRLDFDAEPSVFAKILPRNNCSRQVQADNLARFLAHCGAAVQTPSPGFPRRLDSETVILAMPFLEGDYAQPTSGQMYNLGNSLARLHRCMRKNPFAAETRSAAQQRMKTLESAREAIEAGKDPGGPLAPELKARIGGASLELNANNCQMIHGDLTVANVLFDENEVPLFLDFEDALYSWLPPIADVAMVIERFILVFEGLDESAKLNMAHAFLSGYTDMSRETPIQRRGELQKTLRWLAVRSLVTLAVFSWEGQEIPDAEWQKFIYLDDNARRSADLLAIVEQAIIAGGAAA